MDEFEQFEIINEINEFFLQDEINEKNLSEITQIHVDDLPECKKLTFQVDLTLNSLQNLPAMCPSLLELKLNGSKVASLLRFNVSGTWEPPCRLWKFSMWDAAPSTISQEYRLCPIFRNYMLLSTLSMIFQRFVSIRNWKSWIWRAMIFRIWNKST